MRWARNVGISPRKLSPEELNKAETGARNSGPPGVGCGWRERICDRRIRRDPGRRHSGAAHNNTSLASLPNAS